MKPGGQYQFSLAKKRVGVYFNDGGHSMWVQQDKDAAKPDERLAEAIVAAWKAFNAVYFPKRAGLTASKKPSPKREQRFTAKKETR